MLLVLNPRQVSCKAEAGTERRCDPLKVEADPSVTSTAQGAPGDTRSRQRPAAFRRSALPTLQPHRETYAPVALATRFVEICHDSHQKL